MIIDSAMSTFLKYTATEVEIVAQIIWSRGHPVELLLDVLQILLDVQQDSTGRPVEFCKFASNVLELLISSRNAIKISTGRPVELLYRTSPRAEVLADYFNSDIVNFFSCQYHRAINKYNHTDSEISAISMFIAIHNLIILNESILGAVTLETFNSMSYE